MRRGKIAPIFDFCQINFWEKIADAKCQSWDKKLPTLDAELATDVRIVPTTGTVRTFR